MSSAPLSHWSSLISFPSGFEFSGIVVEFGEASDDQDLEKKFAARKVEVGSEVFGVTRFFAYSSHIVVPK